MRATPTVSPSGEGSQHGSGATGNPFWEDMYVHCVIDKGGADGGGGRGGGVEDRVALVARGTGWRGREMRSASFLLAAVSRCGRVQGGELGGELQTPLPPVVPNNGRYVLLHFEKYHG